jgi:hypothetical protein
MRTESELLPEEPIEKSTWGAGPWQTEPDRVEWEHAGLPCLARRNPHSGNWCGYAAVPPGHPFHGLKYNGDSADDGFSATPAGQVDVHGGLTYSGFCDGHICHVPKPGAPANVFWFGFDCGHSCDFAPGYAARYPDFFTNAQRREEVYRDLAYVTAEINQLAEQLVAVALKPRRAIELD